MGDAVCAQLQVHHKRFTEIQCRLAGNKRLVMDARTSHIAEQRPSIFSRIGTGCSKHLRKRCDKIKESCTIVTHAVRTAQPCVVFTTTDDSTGHSLQELAVEVKQQLSLEAIVISPHVVKAGKGSTASPGAAQHRFSFDKELELLPQRQSGVYHVAGATAADCVLCVVDGKAGLLAALGLTAALVVVGVHRGHALSADVDLNPAVLVARQASQLGIPSIATCLATESTAAPTQPAAQATVHLIQQAIRCLKSTNSTWPAPANYPRAHFPFPEQGRWALGKELPLPQNSSSNDSKGLPWHTADCWALGEDSSWAGSYHRAQQVVGSSSQNNSSRSVAQAASILQRAFADADIMLCVNVPPNWQQIEGGDMPSSSKRFASTRPGVLWHCYQVQADASIPLTQQHEQLHSMTAVCSAPLDTKHDAAIGRWEAAGMRLRDTSWQSTTADLYGRSLPSTSFTGSQTVETGALVAQDNTDKIITWMKADAQPSARQIPSIFTLSKGTILNDHATAGDVEAVFDGKAAVSTLQTWPVGHPLSLRDDVMAASLEEDDEGLPLWLTMT